MKIRIIIAIVIIVIILLLVFLAYRHGRNSVNTGTMTGQDVIYTQIEESFYEHYTPPEAGMEDDYLNHLIDNLRRTGGMCAQP